MRGTALLDLIVFLLVSPLAHSLKGYEISKFSEESVSSQISEPVRESSYVLASTVDGSISLVDMSSQKLDWTFHTNEPIYSSYKAPHYHFSNDEERASALGDDFYMDCDKDWHLYNCTMRKGKCINEIVDASEFIGRLPYTLKDRIVLGRKDTSVMLLDWKTGKLVKRYRMDELYSNTVIQDDKEKAIVLSKEAPLLFGPGFKESEDLPELVYIERKDFKIQCISKFGDVLWSVSYAVMEAKVQHHELVGGLSSSAGIPINNYRGEKQIPPSYTRSVPVIQLRNVNYEKLFPRLSFQDGALYLPIQDRKQNQLAPGDGNQLALPSSKEAEEVLSLPLPDTVMSQITDIIDGSTTETGSASKSSNLIVFLIGFCVSILSVCGLFFHRLRQNMWIKEPSASKVAIVIPKKKKPKKSGTIKVVHKKENEYITRGNKDPSNEENEKRLVTAFPGFNNTPAEGYRVGKLFVSNKEIAKGSNGTVVLDGSYEGRLVAVKRLVQTHHEVAQKEILNLMASDKHPNIVRWYGVDQDEHFIYISLERCACSLNDLLCASSRLLESPMASSSIHSIQINPILENVEGVKLWKENGHPSPVLLKLMRDIVVGLVHLHDIGIVHRDLKPQNVLIVKNNSSLCAKLSDMGISKHLPADTSALTRNSTGSGSSGWQAPEQLRNERQTRAVDLFSLGCVLFFCMTGGEHPYGDNYERDINVLNDQKDLFLIESIPEAVHLLSGLLHPDPNLRPRAQEVLHHPFFWNSDMRLSFLRDASDRVELENREEGSQLLAALESTAAVTLNGRWDEKLDGIFLDNIGRYRRYKFDSIRDLLRVIRNKMNHYRELPKELQELLGSVPEGFDRYFSSRFPKLLIQVYTVLYEYCNNEEFFFKYSKTSVF